MQIIWIGKFFFFQPPSKVLLKDHKPQLGSPALKQTVHTQSAEGNSGVIRSMSPVLLKEQLHNCITDLTGARVTIWIFFRLTQIFHI